jgi:transposase-like protein
MDSPAKSTAADDVPTRVFETFLEAITAAGVAPEMVSRLKKALLEDRDFTEDGLETAIFGEGIADD